MVNNVVCVLNDEKTSFIEVLIAGKELEEDEIIAELSLFDFYGFDTSDNQIKGYIGAVEFDEQLLKALATERNFTYEINSLPKQNWNELWESNFEPVMVNGLVGVRASFHPMFQDVEHEIVITPKMSFGTGHHPTTYLMLEKMGSMSFSGKSVLDFGTGTGILAIMAEKLGASRILGIDNDDWCIENANENIVVNACHNIFIEKSDSIDKEKRCDILLANINKHIILANLEIMSHSLSSNGAMLLSGLLEQDEVEILTTAARLNLAHVSTDHRNRWILIVLANNEL